MANMYIKLLITCILIPYTLSILPADASLDIFSTSSSAELRFGRFNECIINTEGNDEYWFCGAQSSVSCARIGACCGNRTNYYNHKDGFVINGTTYWCCADDGYTESGSRAVYRGTDKGKIMRADNWIKREIPVTETLAGGVTCTWIKKINVCGTVDNPQDKCTTPPQCDTGYIYQKNQCVKLCDEDSGMAFVDSTSGSCTKCDQIHQGIIDHVCVQCDARTELFDSETQKCIKKTSKFLALIPLFDKCWLCDNPNDLRQCLKDVDAGKPVPAQCELSYKTISTDNQK